MEAVLWLIKRVSFILTHPVVRHFIEGQSLKFISCLHSELEHFENGIHICEGI